MTVEEEARKQACIDAYGLAVEKALEPACADASELEISGGVESSEDVTAQYSHCEHGFVLISGIVDAILQSQCERPGCVGQAVVPPGAAAYHAAKSGGASIDGPVNHTESGGAGETGEMGLEMDACKICDEEADGECQGGCARAAANRTGAQGPSSVVMDTGCLVNGAVTS